MKQPINPILSHVGKDEQGQYVNNYYSLGLTKREHFAAMAMQGLIKRSWFAKTDVYLAVEMADALIAELEKNETDNT